MSEIPNAVKEDKSILFLISIAGNRTIAFKTVKGDAESSGAVMTAISKASPRFKELTFEHCQGSVMALVGVEIPRFSFHRLKGSDSSLIQVYENRVSESGYTVHPVTGDLVIPVTSDPVDEFPFPYGFGIDAVTVRVSNGFTTVTVSGTEGTSDIWSSEPLGKTHSFIVDLNMNSRLIELSQEGKTDSAWTEIYQAVDDVSTGKTK